MTVTVILWLFALDVRKIPKKLAPEASEGLAKLAVRDVAVSAILTIFAGVGGGGCGERVSSKGR